MTAAMVPVIFAYGGWQTASFLTGEMRNPRSDLPRGLVIGVLGVVALYVGVTFICIRALGIDGLAATKTPASEVMRQAMGATGAKLIALGIAVSTAGFLSQSVLTAPRVYYAMARDGLFFRRAAEVNRAHVPGVSLAMQGAWACFLVLVRTFDPSSGAYGNLFTNLLEYVISAALLFYILTIAGIFRLRRLEPDAERPYRAWGYPAVPGLYLVGAAVILAVLFRYRPATTFPGLVIVLIGVPIYFWFRRTAAAKG